MVPFKKAGSYTQAQAEAIILEVLKKDIAKSLLDLHVPLPNPNPKTKTETEPAKK